MVSSSYWSILFTTVLVVVVDQGSKWLMVHYFPNQVLYNYQGTWGILPWWAPIFGFVSLLGLAWYQQSVTLPWVVLFTAGLSNMVDRWQHGGVVDFISIGSFPVFNGADVMITMSIVWLAMSEFFSKKNPTS